MGQQPLSRKTAALWGVVASGVLGIAFFYDGGEGARAGIAFARLPLPVKVVGLVPGCLLLIYAAFPASRLGQVGQRVYFTAQAIWAFTRRRR